MRFTKVTTILFWAILAISLFFIISFLKNFDPDASNRAMNTWMNALLIWAYILLAFSFIAVLVLELFHLVADKKAARKSLIIIGLLGMIFLVSFVLSDSNLPQFHGVEKYIADGTLTPAISLWIETGLMATYSLTAMSILGIVYSFIYRLFN